MSSWIATISEILKGKNREKSVYRYGYNTLFWDTKNSSLLYLGFSP